MDAQIATLQSPADAVFLLDAGGRPRRVNAQAEKMCSTSDVVRYAVGGRLVFKDLIANAALSRAIGTIATRGYLHLPGPIYVRTADASFSHIATVVPFVPEEEATPGLFHTAYEERPIAVLFLRPRSDGYAPRAEDLERSFDLTPTEAILSLAIFEGKTLSIHAAERGVSIQTVRKQLASVFDKTDVSQQSQLVSLLAKTIRSSALSAG